MSNLSREEEVWLRVYCSLAGFSYDRRMEWANIAVMQFNDRFPAKTVEMSEAKMASITNSPLYKYQTPKKNTDPEILSFLEMHPEGV